MKQFILISLILALFLPAISFAQITECASADPAECPQKRNTNIYKNSQSIQLPNPLGEGKDDPRIILGNILKVVLGMVGSLALVIFMYGGLTWMTSAGNSDRVKSGRDTLVWATLGLLVIFASYTLVAYIFQIFIE